MTNTKFTDLPDGWSVEIADNATIFVAYRDVDLLAVWLPFDDQATDPTITVPSERQLRDALKYVVDDCETDPPITDWGEVDETVVNLIDLCHAVDSIQAQLGVNRVEKERKDRIAAIVDNIRTHGSSRERQLIEELGL